MRSVFRADGKALSPAWVIKLSRIAKISTAIVRRKPSFSDKMQSLLRYARAHGEDYCATFFDVRILNIVEDVKSFNVLGSNYIATYIRYVLVHKMIIKHQDCSHVL